MQQYGSLEAIQQAIRQGQLSSSQLVDHYLVRAQAAQPYNCYVEVFAEAARRRAAEQDAKRTDGQLLGPLDGCVLSVKDNICIAEQEVTAGSKILEGFRSLFTATAIERLLEAGAILIGRTNCDEFGMGSTNEYSTYGPTRNGVAQDHIPGGSSGGAAVSVQLDTCLLAVGSDTGGSIRQPASFCGLYGLKPTYGRISRYGLIAYASSFDQIGLIGRHPADLDTALRIMAGPDGYDATALPDALQPFALPDSARIAYFPEALEHPQLDPAIAAACRRQLAHWQTEGYTILPVEFDLLEYIVPTYYVLTTAEASSNLARYDGLRYGYRSKQASDLQDTYELSRTEGFGPEVKRRILLGTFVLSSGYYDAYYGRAQRVRRLLRDRIQQVFEAADLLLLPVSPTAAWKIGASGHDPVATYLADIFTVLANLVGNPALAIPAGRHPDSQLPIGYQLLAPEKREDWLLGFANELLPSR